MMIQRRQGLDYRGRLFNTLGLRELARREIGGTRLEKSCCVRNQYEGLPRAHKRRAAYAHSYLTWLATGMSSLVALSHCRMYVLRLGRPPSALRYALRCALRYAPRYAPRSAPSVCAPLGLPGRHSARAPGRAAVPGSRDGGMVKWTKR